MNELNHENQFAGLVGTVTVQDDVFSNQPMERLGAALDTDVFRRNAALPWHWFHFLGMSKTTDLAPDGHPACRRVLSSSEYPRRMWAGSSIDILAKSPNPGERIVRTSRVQSVDRKLGNSGELIFVGIEHEIAGTSGVFLHERQNLVYRKAASGGQTPTPGKSATNEARWIKHVQPHAALLFRFSALTYNAHRIHYDRGYATEAEGYPGLVVHGPLQAVLILSLALERFPDRSVRKFSVRATRPLFDLGPFKVAASPAAEPDELQLWTEDGSGFVGMEAKVSFAKETKEI